jgi:predicted TIM-barrel fold metal-dependent hydrolase
MFGSNFPIEKMWTSYDQLVDVFVSAIDDLSVDDRAAILHGTARHAYRLPDPVPERTTK